ncbi:MAG: MarR family winged helix-turn-helix transcriptional regulator [Solirubrobacteraceae bacterium]
MHALADTSRTAQDLRVAVGRIARRLRDFYGAAESERELSFSEVSVLSRLLRHGPCAPGALADSEHVTPQAIGNVLGRLQSRGMVARRPDPSDGRKVIVAITPRGTRAFDDRSHAVSERLADVLAGEFSPAEVRRLAGVLPLLERLADRL